MTPAEFCSRRREMVDKLKRGDGDDFYPEAFISLGVLIELYGTNELREKAARELWEIHPAKTGRNAR